MKTHIDLQKQFDVKNDIPNKRFVFTAQTNDTNSYTVSYFECDKSEINAWIVLSKAVKKEKR